MSGKARRAIAELPSVSADVWVAKKSARMPKSSTGEGNLDRVALEVL